MYGVSSGEVITLASPFSSAVRAPSAPDPNASFRLATAANVRASCFCRKLQRRLQSHSPAAASPNTRATPAAPTTTAATIAGDRPPFGGGGGSGEARWEGVGLSEGESRRVGDCVPEGAGGGEAEADGVAVVADGLGLALAVAEKAPGPPKNATQGTAGTGLKLTPSVDTANVAAISPKPVVTLAPEHASCCAVVPGAAHHDTKAFARGSATPQL
jgi:hypothetical protein